MQGFPQRYIVLDTETTSTPVGESGTHTELTFRLGCARYTELPVGGVGHHSTFAFRETRELHDYIASIHYDRQPIYIFAHNMGFDARMADFFRELARGTYSLTPPPGTPRAKSYGDPLAVIEDSPFILRLFRTDGQVLILLDTVQWFGCSLADLGVQIGMPKLELPVGECTDEELSRYCERDVEILDAALHKLWQWLRSMGVDDWQWTRASQAMATWKAKTGRGKIVPPSDPSVFHLDRHAYYGGKVMPLRMGRIEGPLWKVDMNSMYPFIMRNNVFPVEVVAHDHSPECKTDFDLSQALSFTAEVWLETEETPYPVRCSNGTYHCTGRVRTILCGPELEAARAWGHVRSVGRWTRYRMDRIFTKYVDVFHNARIDARTSGEAWKEHLCKLMLNSLYGKFGQRVGEWENVGQEYSRETYCAGKIIGPTMGKDASFRVIAGYMQLRKCDQEDGRGFVPIAAYTASYGRNCIDAWVRQLGVDHCSYVAVDSLVVDDHALTWLGDNLYLHPDELGKWKMEGPYQWVDVRGVGNLSLEGREQHMGLKRKSRPIGADWFEVEEWEGAATGIFRGNVSSASVQRTAKNFPSRYAHGAISDSGCVRPWSISNWDISPEVQATRPLQR